MKGEARASATGRSSRREPRRHGRPVWPWVAGLVGIGVVAAFYFGLVGPYSPPATRSDRPAAERPADPRITLVAGEAAPDLTLPRVGGGVFRLSEHRGKTNILLFFQEGAMCPPCWQQMRDLKGDGEKLAAMNVALITLAVDPPDLLRQTAERERVDDMLLLYDKDAQVSKRYQTTYVSMHPGERPGHTFILVDTEGKIVWRRDFREMHVPDQVILEAVAKALGR